MSTRDTKERSTGTQIIQQWVKNTSPPYQWVKITDNRNNITVETNSQFTGVDNPNWRTEIKRKVQAGTSASGYKATFSPTIGYGTGTNATKDTIAHHEGRVPGEVLAWTPGVVFSASKADSAARMDFLSKYSSRKQSFSTGVFLGELRETLHMIRHPALALRKGLDTYHGAVKERTRRIRSERTKRAVIGGTWLEYSFGWAPFVNDIKDGMMALAETISGKYVSNVIIGKGSDSEPILQSTITGGVGPLNWRLSYQTIGVITVRYKGEVVSEMATFNSSIRENWGIRFSDFVPTVWELIPYSFLVDYFSNVGDVLSAMSEGTVRLAWGNQTARLERNTRLVNGYYYPLSNGTAYGNLAGGSSKLVSWSRTPVGAVSVGIGDLSFKVPGFGSKKWLNIGALALLRR